MPMVIKFGPVIREHCVSNLVTCSSYVLNSRKLVEGELWAEVTDVTIWGHIKILPGMCQVI